MGRSDHKGSPLQGYRGFDLQQGYFSLSSTDLRCQRWRWSVLGRGIRPGRAVLYGSRPIRIIPYQIEYQQAAVCNMIFEFEAVSTVLTKGSLSEPYLIDPKYTWHGYLHGHLGMNESAILPRLRSDWAKQLMWDNQNNYSVPT